MPFKSKDQKRLWQRNYMRNYRQKPYLNEGRHRLRYKLECYFHITQENFLFLKQKVHSPEDINKLLNEAIMELQATEELKIATKDTLSQ